MRNPSVLVTILIAALCLNAAQNPQESWENLRQLRPGDDIEVVDVHMKSHLGRFASYTEEAIAFGHPGHEMIVARKDVASVKRRQSHRRRNALVGLAIGAVCGLAVGTIKGKTYHEQGETPVFIAVWTPIGAGVGAAAGAALPSGRQVTVYRARTVRAVGI